jgi:hypothetical protein
MCTSGCADVLIVATNLGSLILFDLNTNQEINPTLFTNLNYIAVLENSVKDWQNLQED